MPRTCKACNSHKRGEIDRALALGEPLRNIAKHVAISPAALLRHKRDHIGTAVAQVAAECKVEDRLTGEMVLNRLRLHGSTNASMAARSPLLNPASHAWSCLAAGVFGNVNWACATGAWPASHGTPSTARPAGLVIATINAATQRTGFTALEFTPALLLMHCSLQLGILSFDPLVSRPPRVS